jgi:uncharacterized membrane protein
MTRSFLPAPRRALLATLVAASLAGASAAATAAVVITSIGTGGITDVSADGNAAVGMENGSYETFRWTPEGGKQMLGRSPYRKLQTGGGLPAISADGTVIASTILDDTGKVVTEGRWTVAGGWQQLTPPLPPDGGVMDKNDSDVWGMSRDGLTVTGLYWRPNQTGGSAHGSVWTAATNMVGMPTDGGSSRIDDANGDGSVLVGWEESPTYGYRRAAVWVNGVKTILGSDEGAGSEAAKVNAAGTIIVGQAYDPVSGRSVAAKWTWNGTAWVLQLLGVIPNGAKRSAFAYAEGLSEDGSVVVGMDRDNSMVFTSRGFIWTEATGMVDFEAFTRSEGTNLRREFRVSEVSAVTPDGRVFMVNGSPVKNPYLRKALRVEKVDVTAAKR